MNTQAMNIVIAINCKYIRYAYVLLSSLLENNSCPIHVFIFHRELTDKDKALFYPLTESYSVAFHFVSIPDALLPPKEVLATSPWGIEAYFRLAITDLLPPEIDRALYFDSDIIINGSLSNLYFSDFAGNKIAACKEFECKPPFGSYRDELFCDLFDTDFSYFNSGMVLYDLNALRPSYSFSYYMDMAKQLQYKIKYPDQDLLNYCHHGETLFVDTFLYNLNARHGYINYQMDYAYLKEKSIVVHYASSKPWRGNFLHHNIEQLWWDYAAKTPFHQALLSELVREVLMDETINAYTADLLEKNEELYAKIDRYDALLRKAGIIV